MILLKFLMLIPNRLHIQMVILKGSLLINFSEFLITLTLSKNIIFNLSGTYDNYVKD